MSDEERSPQEPTSDSIQTSSDESGGQEEIESENISQARGTTVKDDTSWILRANFS